MAKVFICYNDNYGDSWIDKVFSTRELATSYARAEYSDEVLEFDVLESLPKDVAEKLKQLEQEDQ